MVVYCVYEQNKENWDPFKPDAMINIFSTKEEAEAYCNEYDMYKDYYVRCWKVKEKWDDE